MAKGKHWLHENSVVLKAVIRAVFGVVWLIDGMLKFQPGMAGTFVQMITSAGQGQPAWLTPWFTFWAGFVSQDPGFWVLLIGAGEIALGLGLIFGVLRKTAYVAGFFLSLLIWAVPEGIGGPYGPSSTDIGTGIIYALVFLNLMIVNATYGPSRLSLDFWIEKRIKWWRALAEFN